MASTKESAEESVRILLDPHIVHDNFPVLEIMFERLCHGLSVTLHNLTSIDVEVSFEEIQTLHFGAYLEKVKNANIFGVFHAEEWDNDGLLTLKTTLARPLVELMLGGEISSETKKKGETDEGTFTQIERHLIDKLMQSCLDALSHQISSITPIHLALSHTETSTRGLAIVRDSSPCIIGSFKIKVDAVTSDLQVVFPYTTIQPVRSLLADAFMGEKMGNDSLWVEHIENELPITHITLDAVLADAWLSIREILKWQKGSSFHLPVSPESNIQLKCLGSPIFTAKMGQKKGMLALSIEESFLNTPFSQADQHTLNPSSSDSSPLSTPSSSPPS